jgi:hypothetical protein
MCSRVRAMSERDLARGSVICCMHFYRVILMDLSRPQFCRSYVSWYNDRTLPICAECDCITQVMHRRPFNRQSGARQTALSVSLRALCMRQNICAVVVVEII